MDVLQERLSALALVKSRATSASFNAISSKGLAVPFRVGQTYALLEGADLYRYPINKRSEAQLRTRMMVFALQLCQGR
jgi:hypothetical protein